MSASQIALIFAAVGVLALASMWLAWRARARRDADIVPGVGPREATPHDDATIASFPRVSYVSTTPADSPFERLAIPGLRYRGYAELTVSRGGATIAVTGERPVFIPAADIRGTGTASGRVGKAVERDGLSLLRWRAGERVVESSFRLADPAEQAAFAEAIDSISLTPSTSQEGAK